MISFTRKTFIIVAATAFGHLLTIWFLPAWILFIVLGIVVSLIVADLVLTRPEFELSREYPPQNEVGKETAVEICVTARFPRALEIELEDTPPGTMLCAGSRHAAALPPGGKCCFSYTVKPMRRGAFAFGPVFLRHTCMLGLARRKIVIDRPDEIRVYPDLDDFRKFTLYTKSSYFLLHGMKPAKLIAEGSVFESLREYRKDDDYTWIDWKATARTGKPITRNYEAERNQNVIMMLDTGRLMGTTVNDITKLDYAIRTALALGTVCLAKGDNVGMMSFGHQAGGFLPPSRGRLHFVEIMRRMYELHPGEADADYEAAFERLLAKKLKRSLIVVFTDLVDTEASSTLVDYLCALHPRHSRLCVVLKDSEVEDTALSSPDEEIDFYRKSVAMRMIEMKKHVTAKLSGSGVGVIEARPEKLSISLIQKYLHLKRVGIF